jgi:hypothetical protein
MRYNTFDKVVALRKSALEVVELVDALNRGTVPDAALRRLPHRIRLLQEQAQKALLGLEDLE